MLLIEFLEHMRIAMLLNLTYWPYFIWQFIAVISSILNGIWKVIGELNVVVVISGWWLRNITAMRKRKIVLFQLDDFVLSKKII